jgi:hypothetical protein
MTLTMFNVVWCRRRAASTWRITIAGGRRRGREQRISRCRQAQGRGSRLVAAADSPGTGGAAGRGAVRAPARAARSAGMGPVRDRGGHRASGVRACHERDGGLRGDRRARHPGVAGLRRPAGRSPRLGRQPASSPRGEPPPRGGKGPWPPAGRGPQRPVGLVPRWPRRQGHLGSTGLCPFCQGQSLGPRSGNARARARRLEGADVGLTSGTSLMPGSLTRRLRAPDAGWFQETQVESGSGGVGYRVPGLRRRRPGEGGRRSPADCPRVPDGIRAGRPAPAAGSARQPGHEGRRATGLAS